MWVEGVAMTNPSSFQEIEQAVDAVLDAETTHFLELAEMMELDPKTDFTGADLSGCDFSSTDLRDANFQSTNFQGANFEVSPLSTRYIPARALAIAREGSLALDLAFWSTSSLGIAYGLAISLDSLNARVLDLDLDLDRALAFDLDRTRLRVLDPDLDLDCAFDLARTLASDSVRALDRALDLDRDLDRDIALDRARARALALDFDRDLVDRTISQFNLAKAYAHSCKLVLARHGADLSGADLSGADLSAAKVNGAIMTGCQGLSPEAIEDLERRGAIFNDEDREPAFVIAPFAPR